MNKHEQYASAVRKSGMPNADEVADFIIEQEANNSNVKLFCQLINENNKVTKQMKDFARTFSRINSKP